MKKNIDKNLIPLLISVLLVLVSIGITFSTDYVFGYKHYVGITLILISILLYFKNTKWFIYVFGLTLIIGTVDLIGIYYRTILFGIGPIEFNPIFLVLLILFLALNKELLNKMFPEKELSEQDLAERNAQKEALIKSYQRKFQSKTESELKNIGDESSRYVEEAKIASRNVLREKEVL